MVGLNDAPRLLKDKLLGNGKTTGRKEDSI